MDSIETFLISKVFTYIHETVYQVRIGFFVVTQHSDLINKSFQCTCGAIASLLPHCHQFKIRAASVVTVHLVQDTLLLSLQNFI